MRAPCPGGFVAFCSLAAESQILFRVLGYVRCA